MNSIDSFQAPWFNLSFKGVVLVLGMVLPNSTKILILSSLIFVGFKPTHKLTRMSIPYVGRVVSKRELHCHLKKNLFSHFDHVRMIVLPRVSKELQQILTPHQDVDGNWLLFSEGINYGDLFHSHIRVPLTLVSDGRPGLDSVFTDTSLYHLQYHSFEYHGHFTKAWKRELAQIDDEEINVWLESIAKRDQELKAFPDYTMVDGILTELKPSSEEQRKRWANLWFDRFKQKRSWTIDLKQWHMERLLEKLRIIDPEIFVSHLSITENRSIVSTNERFTVIKPINIDGYNQPANVYFEERSDNREIEAIINRAQSQGLSHIINSSSPHFDASSFPLDTDWELHTQLSKEIRAAALASSDDLYAYKHHFGGDYTFENHYMMAWDETYFFSVRYSLTECREPLE